MSPKMKEELDYQTKRIADIFDEVTLWSAPFGRLLLENIPMKSKSTVVDLGFGTGFPLVELAQRFGEESKIYGVDIWEDGISKAKEKIDVLDLSNVQIFEQSAVSIPLEDGTVDLISSNLGVNNFDEKEKVFSECYRILKKGGHLCLTTNPVGTFWELYELFEIIISEFNDPSLKTQLNDNINHRGTRDSIINELSEAGFRREKEVADSTNFRFVSALTLLNHSLIRVGFRESWGDLVPENLRSIFFQRLQEEIDKRIKIDGEFRISVPMLYLEFEK